MDLWTRPSDRRYYWIGLERDLFGLAVVIAHGGRHRGPKVRAIPALDVEDGERIIARLSGLPEVTAVHSTNGRWDLIAEIGTRTLEELDGVLMKVRGFDGVSASETSLLLSTRRAGRR